MSFANLKRNKSKINDLIDAAEKVGGDKKYGDDRFWKQTVDKAGNAFSIIRFLPESEGAAVPWVRYWDHGFEGPGGWYIEKSLTSLGNDDPLGEYNSVLWQDGDGSAGRQQARDQKRRLHYVTNIYVVSDPGNPANDGKVFLYQFGKKIFDKIRNAMNPEFEDEAKINPFDFWKGANFKLKRVKADGWPNYDKSEFEAATPLLDDDDELEKIYNNLVDLSEFTDPKNYKSYSELEKRMNRVLMLDNVQKNNTDRVSIDTKEDAPAIKEEKPPLENSDDADDDLSFFTQLANAD